MGLNIKDKVIKIVEEGNKNLIASENWHQNIFLCLC